MSSYSPTFRKSPGTVGVDKSSPIPYYIQLKETLRDSIERGEWKVGEQIPGEPQLCQIYDVSRTVVRQALKELTYEGLLVREKGRGTFVAEPKISDSLIQNLTGFHRDMEERGLSPVSRVLKQEFSPANQKVAQILNLEPEAQVIEIERLRFIQNEPIVLVTTYLPSGPCQNLLQADLSRQSMYEFMEKKCGLFIVRGKRTIEAVAANEREASLLQVERGSPLILVESVSYLENGTPIEYFHALHRGDRSRFEVDLVRRREYGRG